MTLVSTLDECCPINMDMYNTITVVAPVLIFYPLLIVFAFPLTLLAMMYATVVFLHVYRHRRRQIYDAYSENFWDGAKQTVAAVFDAQATYWNGILFILVNFIRLECMRILGLQTSV